jgi:hypothetical protein
MFTLLERHYNHQRAIMARVLASLLDSRDRLIESRRTDPPSRDLLFTVGTLYRRAVEVQTRVAGPHDPIAAWHALQSKYVLAMNTHTGALTSMLVVLNAASGPAAVKAASEDQKPTAAYWRGVGEAWDVCWGFLADSAFPYLPTLKDLFEASLAPLAVKGGDTLLAFNSARAAVFAERLADLERTPALFTANYRLSLEPEAFAWFHALLRAPEPDQREQSRRRFEGSHLLRLLSENPCEVASAWDLARGRCANAGLAIARILGEMPRGLLAFCSRTLLVETFMHIIQNAAGSAHMAPGRPLEGVTVGISVTNVEGYIDVIIANNWTEASEGHEGGLAFFRDELSPFGAELIHWAGMSAEQSRGKATPEPTWTYTVRVHLRRWQEPGG